MFLFFTFLTVLDDFSIFKIESILFLCHLMIWIAQNRILQRCFQFIAARFEGYISQSASNNPSNYWYCMLKKARKNLFCHFDTKPFRYALYYRIYRTFS